MTLHPRLSCSPNPFPNCALAVLPDVACWYQAHPVAAGRTHLRTHQLLQRGVQTTAARPGPLSPFERHNATFAQWYRVAMGGGVPYAS